MPAASAQARRAPRPSTAGAADIAGGAIVTGVILTLLMPPPLLDAWGFAYSTPSGAPWSKIHPGSDLIVLGTAWGAMRERRPVDWAIVKARRFAGTAVFAVTLAFFLGYTLLVIKAPFTPLIDTFFVPIVLFFGLTDLDDRWRGRLETVLHVFVAINATLGIVEFVTAWRLIPMTLDGVALTAEYDARATGFLGHPLASASMAGLYAVILMAGGGTRLPASLRAPALMLQFLALAAFGGRTALVMTTACFAVTGIVAVLRVLGGGRLDLRMLGLAILCAPLLLAVVAAVAHGGFFDMVLDRFVEDNGSAKTRQSIFELFGYMSWQDLLLGPDLEHLVTLQNHLGMEAGIESFWLGLLFYCGLLPELVLCTGFGLFLHDVMRQARMAAVVPLLFFLGIISSSVSLTAKSVMLSHFVAMVLILMPRTASKRRSARAPLRPAGLAIP